MFKKINDWWDSYCNRCGLCCYEKIPQDDGSWVLDMSDPCPWLDKKTNLCRVYKKRFKVYPRCRHVNLWRALFAPYLPPTCGYVRKFRPKWLPGSRLIIKDSGDLL